MIQISIKIYYQYRYIFVIFDQYSLCMRKQTKNKELLYLQIAGSLEQQINNDTLKVGDKLPSIRMICRQHGVSMTTAQYAYYELEARSLIEPRPQSGYYVSNSFRKKLAM